MDPDEILDEIEELLDSKGPCWEILEQIREVVAERPELVELREVHL